MDLRQPVLRAWSGGEPDQAAQDAALIGSHVLPFRRRQSGSARPAHLRLLADADRPRRHSQTVRSGQGRVRDLAPSSAQIAARVIETARAVRLAFAACHPEAALFASLPGALAPLGP